MVKGGRHPARVGGMTGYAIRREICSKVVGVGGLVVVVLVAKHAVRRGIGIIAGSVALCTILYVVALGEREKIVIDNGRHPAGVGAVAGSTVCGKAAGLVVGVLCGSIIVLVTIHTFRRGIRVIAGSMAFCTILDIMSLC